MKPDILAECPTGFRGDGEAVTHLANSGLDVFAHNIETVSRCRAGATRGSSHEQSLKGVALKPPARMAGHEDFHHARLGETTRRSRLRCGTAKPRADIFTLGQYLRPTANHLEVNATRRSLSMKMLGKTPPGSVRRVRAARAPSYKVGEFFIETMLREDREQE